MTATFFFSGIAAATFGVSALFLLKFWYASRDRFFLYLSAAYWLLATERVAALLSFQVMPLAAESHRMWIYSFRLLAFVLIIIAVLEKNRPRSAI